MNLAASCGVILFSLSFFILSGGMIVVLKTFPYMHQKVTFSMNAIKHIAKNPAAAK